MAEELNNARLNLQKILGVEFKNYCEMLKKWFLGQISKEDFDLQARLLFTASTVHYHNDFFASLLNKCNINQSLNKLAVKSSLTRDQNTIARSKGLKALKRIHRSATAAFNPQNAFRDVPFSPNDPNIADALPALAFAHLNGISSQCCSKEGILPDASMVHGRILVACWEQGLDDVDQQSLSLIICALKDALKNLIHACVEQRRTHLIFDHRFQHMFGIDDPSIGNNIFVPDVNNRISGDTIELKQCAITSTLISRPKTKISLADLLDALKMNPDLIPVQSLYNCFMERLLCHN